MDILNKLEGGEIIGFAAVVGGLLVALFSVVATQWRRARVAEIEASLKQQMLDKGMSAAEIETVMRASNVLSGSSSTTGIESVDRAALVQRMVDEGYSGDDIERVLKAYNVSPKSPEVQAVRNQA